MPLITDYSSIYYDYLPLKRLIGLAAPDVKEFSAACPSAEKRYKDFVKR